MPHKFKKGDKVRCIDDSPHSNGANGPTLGRIYTVAKDQVTHGGLKFEEIGLGWKADRFEPAKLTNEQRIKKREEAINAV
jgi:hypothetical protein